jgi:putative membrane-bound dehydrogenase-like protein
MKRIWLIGSALCLVAAAPLRAETQGLNLFKRAGLSPEEAVHEMTLPPGFKATLFAAEPDVQQPIAFCIDDRGRLWVAENYTYPIRTGKPPRDPRPAGADRSEPTPEQLADIFGGRDRILVFEDTDGDGRFDRRTVFLEKLNLLSGIEVGFGGVWIGAAPYLLFVPVQDGDAPRPAAPPRILLDGWGWQDTHETLNTFVWGPDGWLYGCHGVFTHSNVGKPGAPDSERARINAGVWRYHPTRHVFEVFAEGTSNPWGLDFDEHGQCFIEACVIPHLFHVIQGARYHRQAGSHFNPHIYQDIPTIADHVHWVGEQGPHAGNRRSAAAGGGHAHAGLMIYQGENWPERYRGQIFIGNIHGACINWDTPERKGSGFVGRHNPNLIEFNDEWSQVVNFQAGPDGAVYFIDWYDKNQCHSGDPNVHDRSNGRIFKISHGEPKFERINLARLADEQLVPLVASRNEFLSRHARRILQERHGVPANRPDREEAAAAVAQRLTRMLSDGPDTRTKLRALWTLHVIGRASTLLLLEQLRSPEEYVRAWAIQLAFESRRADTPRLLEECVRLAREDASPVVRLYLAAAMQRLPAAERWEVVEALSQRAEDADDHNIPLMVWYAAEPLPTVDFERALQLARAAKLPKLLDFMVRRTAALDTPEAMAAITRLLERAADDAQRLEILNGLTAALKGRRNVPMPAGWAAVEEALGESPNAQIRSRVQALSLGFGSARALEAVRRTLLDPRADAAARLDALESLLTRRDPELPGRLRGLLGDAALRGPVLRALGTFDDPETPAAILAVYAGLNAAEKRDALNTLASRAPFAVALLRAVGEGRVPSRDITAELARQLRNLKHAEVDEWLLKVWGAARETAADKKAEIERYRKIYRAGGSQPGDAMRGRAVFARICQQCHRLFDTGGHIGPDLTGSNRRDLDYLLENILDPNAVVPNEYRSWIVETKDDRILTGLLPSQTDRTITLVTQTETLTLPREDIVSLQESPLSMMPEGLLAQLSEPEVRDLIFYLRQPGQVPLPAAPDNAALFFNGKDLAFWDGDPALWTVENGEIVGRTATGLKHNAFLKSHFLLEDFRLVCKVKLVPNTANSGIQFRSEPLEEHEMKGCQADIGAGWWGKLYEENGRKLLWKKSGDAFVKPEDWNTYEILAVGSRIRTAINGHLCVDLDDPQVARRGVIGLQLHAGGPTEVRFKDFELELNPAFELRTVSRHAPNAPVAQNP